MHIVEEIIAERAGKLMSRKRLFKLIKPILYRTLAYDAAVFLADAVAYKTGYEAFEFITDHINPQVSLKCLKNLPGSGRCIIVANHPTGLADGIYVHQAIRDRRPDHIFFANADVLRVVPNCRDIIIPVEWDKEKRSFSKTRETLTGCRKALEGEKCIVICPSGRLSHMTWRGLQERPWESSAAKLAKKYNAPVVPLRIEARNSWIFYVLSQLNTELRDVALVKELLNKRGQIFRLTFGRPVDPATLPKDGNESTKIIRRIVETL
ncbi:MAG: 1-acyl-sn-glycerol-3-phosphate acyltransferase [Hyphomonadaceae bacterium]|nr:1-acyl-sn-glycerol-3-phosphate acyltransferase [Hyphomonadaceae bacterium]MBC6412327.1 1-acyl-sn-glycerol-3-phosphate acyltransferase [Hyphomonadaceae bacterium]